MNKGGPTIWYIRDDPSREKTGGSSTREQVEAYSVLAKQRGVKPVQFALSYVASRWYLGSSITGATSVYNSRKISPPRNSNSVVEPSLLRLDHNKFRIHIG
jgi:hypothetical protein